MIQQQPPGSGRTLKKSAKHDHQKLDVCIGCLVEEQVELFWHTGARLARLLLLLEEKDLHELIKSLPLEPNETEDQIEALQELEHADEFPESKPDVLRQDLWELLSNDQSRDFSHSEHMGQIEIITGILSMDVAAQYLQKGKVAACFASCSRAHMHLGMALVQAGSSFAKDSLRSVAQRGGNAKVAQDPKQRTKDKAKEYWLRWQELPSLYVGPEAYAKDMMNKFGPESDLPEDQAIQNIESPRRWHRQWKAQEILLSWLGSYSSACVRIHPASCNRFNRAQRVQSASYRSTSDAPRVVEDIDHKDIDTFKVCNKGICR